MRLFLAALFWFHSSVAAPSIDPGFLACDGSAVSRTTYASLFSAIGTTYGAGDGSTTFNVPDLMRHRGE
jgi:microcystin-dependent protein